MFRFPIRIASGIIAALMVFILAGLATGCEAARSAIASAQKPTAIFKTARVDALSIKGARLGFDVEVTNPYSVALPLTDVDYLLSSAGRQFVSGRTALSGTIPARGTRTITLPAEVAFADALAVLSTVQPGAVVPYAAELDLSVDAPGVGPLTLPMSNIEGQLPIPTAPSISLTEVTWNNLSFDEASAMLNLRVVNHNQFPVGLETMNYALALGGRQIASTATSQSASFTAGGETELAVPISFSPRNLGLAAFNMLTGSGSNYRLSGDLNVTSPFGPIALPFDRQGETAFSR